MKRQNRTFLRYLVPYVLLLFLPITAISIFTQYLIFNEIAQSQHRDNVVSAGRATDAVDTELTKAMQIVYQVKQLTEFRTSAFSSPTAFFYIRRGLLQYTSIVPIISEIIYYNFNQPRLYTTAGTVSLNHADEWERSFWGRSLKTTAYLDTVEKPEWFTDEEKSILILVYPLEKQGGEYVSFFALKLNSVLMESYLTDAHNQNGLAAAMYGPEGNCLYKTRNYEDLVTVRHESYKNQSAFKEMPFEIDFVMPQSVSLKKVTGIQKNFLVILVFVLMTGSAIIIFAMQKTYSPFRRIFSAAKKYAGSDKAGKDDFSLLEGTLMDLAQQNIYMRKLVLQANREQLFRAVIFSPRESAGKLEELTREADIPEWGSGYYSVIQFNGAKDFTFNQAELLANTAAGGDGVLGAYVLSKLASGDVVMIIIHSEADVNDLLERLYGVISSVSPPGIRMAASKPSRDYGNMSASFFEARRQLNASRGTGLTAAARGEAGHPTAELAALQAMVASDNLDRVKDQVAELLAYAEMMSSEIESLQVCFEIVSILNSNRRYSLSLKANAEEPALDQLISLLREHTQGLKETVPYQEAQIRRIIDFINEHYADQDFSVSHLARYFNVSVSGISQKFKQATNCSLLKYVTNLKIEKAKVLLVSTKLNVLRISELLGYAQSSAFIRKFKEIVNCTPGEYRINNKNND